MHSKNGFVNVPTIAKLVLPVNMDHFSVLLKQYEIQKCIGKTIGFYYYRQVCHKEQF